MEFLPNRIKLVAGSAERIARLWDFEKGRVDNTLDSHSYCVSSLCFSPDGNKLASNSILSICIWNVATGQAEHVLNAPEGYFEDMAFSPNGSKLASPQAETTTS